MGRGRTPAAPAFAAMITFEGFPESMYGFAPGPPPFTPGPPPTPLTPSVPLTPIPFLFCAPVPATSSLSLFTPLACVPLPLVPCPDENPFTPPFGCAALTGVEVFTLWGCCEGRALPGRGTADPGRGVDEAVIGRDVVEGIECFAGGSVVAGLVGIGVDNGICC